MSERGYILYHGSRDELNELCRQKDERIAELLSDLAACRDVATLASGHDDSEAVANPLCVADHVSHALSRLREGDQPVAYEENARPWSIDGEHIRDARGQVMVSFDPDDDDGWWPFIVAAVNAYARPSSPPSGCPKDGDWIIKRPLRYEPEGHAEGPAIKDANGQLIAALYWPPHEPEKTDRAVGELHLLASSFVDAANGIDTDNAVVYEIGKRDGYEDAVQDIDLRTGGDGEFYGSTIPGRGQDVPSMLEGIVARFGQGASPPTDRDAIVEECGEKVRARGLAFGPHTSTGNAMLKLAAEIRALSSAPAKEGE